MANNDGGVQFINCVGTDVHLWKKTKNDNLEWVSCVLYDEPEYHLDCPTQTNTTWAFFDHITKRYLHGNGKREFHYQKYQCPPIQVEIKTPLYTLKELCIYTIATRILVNKSMSAINNFEIPKSLKIDLKKCVKDLEKMYEEDGDDFISDWTVSHEEEYNN